MRFRPVVVALLLVAPVSLAPPSPAHAGGFRCDGKAATIVGTSGPDVLTGTSGDDVIVGRAGRDTIDGRGGDDVICGKGGQDVIDGGAGNDHLSGGRAKDWLTGGSGNDHLIGGLGMSNSFNPGPDDDTVNAMSAPALFNYSAAPGPLTIDLEAGTARGWGRDTLHMKHGGSGLGGSAFDDTILGTSGTDSISGGGGVDTIDGRGGGDTIAATAGDLVGGDGVDSLTLRHSGSVDGGPDRDHIFASWDATAIDGGDGDDVLEISAPNGVTSTFPGVSGGAGHDELRLDGQFRTPDDSLVYDMTSGSLQIGAVSGVAPGFEDFTLAGTPSTIDVTGTDGPNHFMTEGSPTGATLRGLGGDDIFFPGAGDDTVDGGDGNDRVFGSMGDDTIDGSTGDDEIEGGPGTDAADGGPGTDSCASVESPTNCENVTP